jgi:hypothetical protein
MWADAILATVGALVAVWAGVRVWRLKKHIALLREPIPAGVDAAQALLARRQKHFGERSLLVVPAWATLMPTPSSPMMRASAFRPVWTC